MLALDKRHILIMRTLINTAEPLSSEVLASVLGATSRTVRNDIKIIDQILQRVGARVLSKSGSGYSLDIVNRGEFNVFLQSFNEKYADNTAIPAYNGERIGAILHQLLIRDSWIKSEAFLDQLYISRTTFSTDLRRIRRILQKYHLDLEQKPNRGIRITGLERHLRILIADYMNVDEEAFSDEIHFSFELDSKRCLDRLTIFLLETNIHVSVQSLEELKNQLLVADYRIRHHHPVVYDDVELEEIKSHAEYAPLKVMLTELMGDISESEIANFCLLVICRRIFGADDPFDLAKHKSLYFLGDEMMKFLYIYTDMDFSADQQTRLYLARELRGMIARITYGFEYRNIGMVEVKQSNIAFEYAVIMCDYLAKKYRYTIHEEEIAVLANYLHYSLITRPPQPSRQNVCLVFSKGKNNALILRERFLQLFGRAVSRVDILEPYELTEQRETDVDLIITDMPRSRFRSTVSIIQVMNNFSRPERHEINSFLSRKGICLHLLLKAFDKHTVLWNLDAESSDEVIRAIAKKMSEQFKITDGFADMVWHREQISSTERGNNAAIAHSLFPACETTRIGLGILKKPILWDQELVQIVFLIANSNEEAQMFRMIEWLQMLCRQMNFIHQLLQADTFSKIREAVDEAFTWVEL